jgi:hypothetical protein
LHMFKDWGEILDQITRTQRHLCTPKSDRT